MNQSNTFFKEDRKLSLDVFLNKFLNKKISYDEALRIADKIYSYFNESYFCTKNIMIIEALANNINLNKELDFKILNLNNEENTLKNKFENLSLEYKIIKNKFEKKENYFTNIQKESQKIIKDITHLSKLKEINKTIKECEEEYKPFLSYKNKNYNNIKNFEIDLYKNINIINNTIYRNIKDITYYKNNIPKVLEYESVLKHTKNSTLFKFRELDKILSKSLEDGLNKKDINVMFNMFFRSEIKHKEYVNEYKIFNNTYKIDKEEKSLLFEILNPKLKKLIELEESIEFIEDNIKYIEFKIDEIKSTNEWYESFKIYNNKINEELSNKIKLYEINIFNRLESFEILNNKKNIISKETVINYNTINIENYNPIIIEKKFNDKTLELKSSNNYNSKGILEKEKEFSFELYS